MDFIVKPFSSRRFQHGYRSVNLHRPTKRHVGSESAVSRRERSRGSDVGDASLAQFDGGTVQRDDAGGVRREVGLLHVVFVLVHGKESR